MENLVVFCCAAWSAAAAGVTRVGDVGPCVYVYGMVTSRANGLSWPTGKSGAIRAFVTFHRQVDRLFCCWYLRSLNGSLDDIIHVAVALFSMGTLAGKTVRAVRACPQLFNAHIYEVYLQT